MENKNISFQCLFQDRTFGDSFRTYNDFKKDLITIENIGNFGPPEKIMKMSSKEAISLAKALYKLAYANGYEKNTYPVREE